MTNDLELTWLSRYVDAALKHADYERDEDGVVIAIVPNASGFYAQGDSVDEARVNLGDVIEGNIMLALRLGLSIPGHGSETFGMGST